MIKYRIKEHPKGNFVIQSDFLFVWITLSSTYPLPGVRYSFSTLKEAKEELESYRKFEIKRSKKPKYYE